MKIEFALNGQQFVTLTPTDGIQFYSMPEGAINQVTPAEGLYFESFSVTMVGVDFRAPAANIEPQCRCASTVLCS